MSRREREAREPRHPIRVVAQRTGLTTDVLRAWEKRYGVVKPGRSTTGHRLYSDEDVERLALLRQVTEAGRAIGGVANLGLTELKAVAREDESHRRASERERIEAAGDAASEHCDAALAAVKEMDPAELDAVLVRAALRLGSRVFLEAVAVPLMQEVGKAWHEQRLGVSHEHLATSATQRVLGWLLWSGTPNRTGPGIVIGTLSGQRHEIGAMLAAAVATEEGWRVVYLGGDLPVEELSRAAQTRGASVIAVSLVYPAAEAGIIAQLRALRSHEPEATLIVGGAASGSYRSVLAEIDAIHLPDLQSFRDVLARLRPASRLTRAATG